MRRSRGFTLIEIAVVIAIIGFLAFMLTPLIGGQIALARVKETRAKLEPLKSAILAFVAANNRLPCPAVENLPSTDPQYGREAASPGTCTGTTALAGGASRGVVPWISLGLTGDAAADSFGRFFTYVVTTSQTNLTANTIPGLTGVIAIHNGAPVAPGNQTNAGNLAVFLLLSYGTNGFGGFNPGSGAQTPLPAAMGADEAENTDTANAAFIDKSFSDNVANPFDDMILWVAPFEILTALERNGVKTPQGAMNEKFAAIKAAILRYMAADSVDPDGPGAGNPRTVARRIPCADTDSNGVEDCSNLVGTVPWSTLKIPALTATDPWGRSIRYAVSAASMLSSVNNSSAGVQTTTPVDRTITLSSDGPDGVQGNADDLTVTITAPDLASALLTAGVFVDN